MLLSLDYNYHLSNFFVCIPHPYLFCFQPVELLPKPLADFEEECLLNQKSIGYARHMYEAYESNRLGRICTNCLGSISVSICVANFPFIQHMFLKQDYYLKTVCSTTQCQTQLLISSGGTRAVVLMTQSGLRFNFGDLSIFFIDGAV